jgi:glucose-6-phosphate isomerase
MVIIAYKDQLEVFFRDLQQRLMDSFGMELDLNRGAFDQRITVLGYKGSKGRHSYIQQLRDGLKGFLVSLIKVLADSHNSASMVKDTATVGDFLHGFSLGTRQAFAEKDRESLAVTGADVLARTVRILTALLDHAVGFYVSLVKINVYHQPGVETGKKAAGLVMEIQRKIVTHLFNKPDKLFTVFEILKAIDMEYDIYNASRVVQHLTASDNHSVSKSSGLSLLNLKYALN